MSRPNIEGKQVRIWLVEDDLHLGRSGGALVKVIHMPVADADSWYFQVLADDGTPGRMLVMQRFAMLEVVDSHD